MANQAGAFERVSRALRGAAAGLLVGLAVGYAAIIPFFLVAGLFAYEVDASYAMSLVLWLAAIGLVLGTIDASPLRLLFSPSRKG